MNFVEQIITKLTGYKNISNFLLIDFFGISKFMFRLQ